MWYGDSKAAIDGRWKFRQAHDVNLYSARYLTCLIYSRLNRSSDVKICEICMLLFSHPWNSTYITGVFMWIVFVSAKRNDEIISNKAINLSGIKEHLDLEMGLERPTGWVYIHWMSRDLWHIFLPYTQRMHSSRIWPGLFTIYFLAVFPRCVQDQLQFGLSVRTVRIMWSKS